MNKRNIVKRVALLGGIVVFVVVVVTTVVMFGGEQTPLEQAPIHNEHTPQEAPDAFVTKETVTQAPIHNEYTLEKAVDAFAAKETITQAPIHNEYTLEKAVDAFAAKETITSGDQLALHNVLVEDYRFRTKKEFGVILSDDLTPWRDYEIYSAYKALGNLHGRGIVDFVRHPDHPPLTIQIEDRRAMDPDYAILLYDPCSNVIVMNGVYSGSRGDLFSFPDLSRWRDWFFYALGNAYDSSRARVSFPDSFDCADWTRAYFSEMDPAYEAAVLSRFSDEEYRRFYREQVVLYKRFAQAFSDFVQGKPQVAEEKYMFYNVWCSRNEQCIEFNGELYKGYR